jgi:hypothetical protein
MCNTVQDVLEEWFGQNLIHPYPTRQQKTDLAEATQLTYDQVCSFTSHMGCVTSDT